MHGLALAVHGPAVGDALLEGSPLAQRAHGGEQGGLEPAAVLVQTLHIHVGGPEAWSFFMAAKWEEPESNQPSRVSVSLVKPALAPQWGQAKPSGRISSASLANQALEPSAAKSLEMASMVSSVQMGLPQSLQ